MDKKKFSIHDSIVENAKRLNHRSLQVCYRLFIQPKFLKVRTSTVASVKVLQQMEHLKEKKGTWKGEAAAQG
jgi:hypothetical protein